MSNTEKILQTIKKFLQTLKGVLYPLYQSMADQCQLAHQNYLAKQQERTAQERAIRIQQNMVCLRGELYDVFSTSRYARLTQVKTLTDIRPVLYEIRQGQILYCFTIAKEQCETIAMTICRSICQDMNNDVLTYSQCLMENFYLQELQTMYPNLYFGIKILNVVNQETNVKLTVVSNRPL